MEMRRTTQERIQKNDLKYIQIIPKRGKRQRVERNKEINPVVKHR